MLVDAAFGAPNLHIFAGVPRPSRSLAEALAAGGPPLAELAVATHVPGVKLIGGVYDPPWIANPGAGAGARDRRAAAPAARRLGRRRSRARARRADARAVPRGRHQAARRGARSDVDRADASVRARGVLQAPRAQGPRAPRADRRQASRSTTRAACRARSTSTSPRSRRRPEVARAARGDPRASRRTS